MSDDDIDENEWYEPTSRPPSIHRHYSFDGEMDDAAAALHNAWANNGSYQDTGQATTSRANEVLPQPRSRPAGQTSRSSKNIAEQQAQAERVMEKYPYIQRLLQQNNYFHNFDIDVLKRTDNANDASDAALCSMLDAVNDHIAQLGNSSVEREGRSQQLEKQLQDQANMAQNVQNQPAQPTYVNTKERIKLTYFNGEESDPVKSRHDFRAWQSNLRKKFRMDYAVFPSHWEQIILVTNGLTEQAHGHVEPFLDTYYNHSLEQEEWEWKTAEDLLQYLEINYDTPDKEGEALRDMDALHMVDPRTGFVRPFCQMLADFNRIAARMRLDDYAKVTRLRSKLSPQLEHLITAQRDKPDLGSYKKWVKMIRELENNINDQRERTQQTPMYGFQPRYAPQTYTTSYVPAYQPTPTQYQTPSPAIFPQSPPSPQNDGDPMELDAFGTRL